jgi:hypothetical protein
MAFRTEHLHIQRSSGRAQYDHGYAFLLVASGRADVGGNTLEAGDVARIAGPFVLETSGNGDSNP